MIPLKNRLIIVEGLTGLGKSTMAHFIARQFQYNGIAADWIHEAEVPHPVDLPVEPDLQTYMVASLSKWEALVDQTLRSGAVTVIEAAFFNNLIETLYAHCLDRESILAYGIELQEVVRPANPALVYLAYPDIEAALERNFRVRGPGFQDFVIQFVARTPIGREKGWDDYAGMVAFWRGFVAITDDLFHAYDIDKFVLDVSAGEWGRYPQEVTGFLGLSLLPDPEIDPEEATKFAGVYRFGDGGSDHNVCYEKGALWTDVFLNVFTKLIPIDETTFSAEKWHFTLDFELDPETDEAKSFTIGGRDVEYLKAMGRQAWKVEGGDPA